MVIIDNLAPLVGSKQGGKRWTPYTGYNTCKALSIARLLCTNIDKDKYQKGHIKYEFDNEVTLRTYEIYSKVKNYDPEILDTSYFVEVKDDSNKQVPMRDLVFMQTHINRFNDSAIFDVFEEQKELKYIKWYPYVMFILLDAFSVRWSLYEYYIEGALYDESELRAERLNRLANNIRYIKVQLEEYNADLTANLNHHLSNLLLNVQATRYHVSDRLILEA